MGLPMVECVKRCFGGRLAEATKTPETLRYYNETPLCLPAPMLTMEEDEDHRGSGSIECVEFLPGQAEEDIIIIAAVKEELPSPCAFLHKSQFLVQGNRRLVCVDTGRVALLKASLVETVPEEETHRILGITLLSVLSVDYEPQAECAVLAVPRV
jgi:hypothetical protein